MNASAAPAVVPPNIVALPTRRTSPKSSQRFSVFEFQNRTGSRSWRVSGIKRDGSRVRLNFSDHESARARQIELETEYLRLASDTRHVATKLSDDKLRLAEMAFLKLGDGWERLLDAIDHWQRSGAANQSAESPLVDDAIAAFMKWLESPACDLAEQTKHGYRIRVGMFGNSVANQRVSEITPATIRKYLEKRETQGNRTIGKTSLKNDRRAICRFLSWCVEKEWIATNPAIGPRTKSGGKLTGKLPSIFTVDECKALLKAAEKHKNGMLAPYVAVCLFAGLRPDSEAERITWKQVNLADRQINIEPWMTKTGIPRTIAIEDTLHRWLTAYKGKEFYPKGWRRNFDKVKELAGIRKWIVDGMRHTAHSHFFRRSGSYGLTAEFFGNSEGIVRKNYVNRVSTQDMERFYSILPRKGAK
jgi:site-specific recombinase XerD